jgi:hypothetical protein
MLCNTWKPLVCGAYPTQLKDAIFLKSEAGLRTEIAAQLISGDEVIE